MITPHFLLIWKEWIVSHKNNFLLFFGLLLVSVVSFESGFLKGKMLTSAPLVISIPVSGNTVATLNATTTPPKDVISTDVKQNTSCPLVGSRNSNKYHLITCAVAKRIKTENRVCFSSKEDAEKRGYVAGCLK